MLTSVFAVLQLARLIAQLQPLTVFCSASCSISPTHDPLRLKTPLSFLSFLADF